MDGQEYDHEDSDQNEGVIAFFLHRAIEPIDEILHPTQRLKRCGRLKDNAQILGV
jgi:hypothetical protein